MVKPARQDDEREFAFTEQEFRFLVQLVNQRTGIVLSDHKMDMVYSRLARRLRALGMTAFSEYCDLLQGPDGSDEIGNLVNAITTNLTSFFREMHHFEHLRDKVLLPLATYPPRPKRLRIWSSACSSGMEPYSIAMTVKSALKNLSEWDARILATDIDTNMLRTGMEGEYTDTQLENIPAPYQKDVQALDKGTMRMSDSLKSLISFKQLNLLDKWPMQGTFDAVFCRNVVIYFDKPTQKVLFDRIADLIKPDGWLYIGHSENLFNVCDRFELIGRTIYQRIR